MKSIKEVEKLTGISSQNIRYYEKQKLIVPGRNPQNDYREYSDQDICRLEKIKLFRKLDMPIEEIRKILNQEISLGEGLQTQKVRLQQEKERLTDVLKFYDRIKEDDIQNFPAEDYLSAMEREEKRGAVFADFLHDYQRVIKAEELRHFSFMPDTMCQTKEEFTEALFQYADKNNMNLVITKEGMYPEFTIDGVEYAADRKFSRYGAVVHCYMKYPDDVIPEDMSKKTYKKYRLLYQALVPSGIVAFFLFFWFTSSESWAEMPVMILMVVAIAITFVATFGYFFHNLKD